MSREKGCSNLPFNETLMSCFDKLHIYVNAVHTIVILLFLLVGNCVIFGNMAQITLSIISSLLNLLRHFLVLRYVLLSFWVSKSQKQRSS